jgi:hypothetical protein
VLVAAYSVSGLLEIVGVGLVVFDVRRDRQIALRLTQDPPTEPVELDERTLRKHPGSLASRRGLLAMEHDSALADAHIRDALSDMLEGHVFRRLRGPALVVLGIIVGTAANIATSG